MKRSAVRIFGKANRLYRRRQYAQVISFLEPQVFLFRESFHYYYLLGMSCFYTGDYAGAFSYIRRALDIEENPDALLGLGAILLRRRQVDQALRTYLDLLDLDNHNRRARKALQWLRRVEHPDAVIEWFEDNRIRRILPPQGVFIPRWVTGVTTAAMVVGVVVYVLYTGFPQRLFGSRENRPGAELVSLTKQPTEALISPDGDFRFEYTQREVEQLFAQVGTYFNAGRDNMVRRELNRIAASNAAPTIQARSEMLRDYLQEPDFSSFHDGFSFAEVSREPMLHDNVYVRWKGRIANLDIGTDRIRFDLLVGYHTGQVVEGIVPVTLEFAVVLENNNPVEILGPVRIGPEGHVRVRATSIRILSQRELN